MNLVDLTIATAKSLVRLRRDDLVRLCESRDLDVEGTKPQLAEALLQWRDRRSEASSPSSAGTVRPPSTVRHRRRLEDREIPPDRLTKLEKIGSGGFKDVFIGKFKGRKVAIAEFRGHLTSSK